MFFSFKLTFPSKSLIKNRALLSVLLAIFSFAGFFLIIEGMIPRAAPPAPKINIFLSFKETFKFSSRSLVKPTPSVQSAINFSSFA